MSENCYSLNDLKRAFNAGADSKIYNISNVYGIPVIVSKTKNTFPRFIKNLIKYKQSTK